MSNIGKSLVRDLRITLNSNEVQSINDYNVLAVYLQELVVAQIRTRKQPDPRRHKPNDGTIRTLQVNANYDLFVLI